MFLQETQISACEFEVQICGMHDLCFGGAARNHSKYDNNNVEFASPFHGMYRLQRL
jgi:hypothetical protein